MVLVLILADVRSAHNVGAIFRTADAVGVKKIYLCGITPTPVDRFGRPRRAIAKTALGAEYSVPFDYFLNARAVLKKLRREGFKIIALEQSGQAKNYKDIKPAAKTALLLGNEVAGLSSSLLNLVDEIAELPMRGKKESLNVAVAAGIALYHFAEL
jgi:tRNA G18 (ribose-2'-O)-methylase SpoU